MTKNVHISQGPRCRVETKSSLESETGSLSSCDTGKACLHFQHYLHTSLVTKNNKACSGTVQSLPITITKPNAHTTALESNVTLRFKTTCLNCYYSGLGSHI